jgi:hypothetical protein
MAKYYHAEMLRTEVSEVSLVLNIPALNYLRSVKEET